MIPFVITDTHSKNIERMLILRGVSLWNEDSLIHLGDYISGELPRYATNILIRGNHDIQETYPQFDLVVDGLLIDGLWLSHEPVSNLPKGAYLNIHGHLHTHPYEDYGYTRKPFHRLLTPNILYKLSDFR